jgi:hypothetical protein
MVSFHITATSEIDLLPDRQILPKPLRDVGRETALIALLWYSPKRRKGTRPTRQITNERKGEGQLQTLTRDKNEKTAEGCVDQCYPRKAHECALVEEFPVM